MTIKRIAVRCQAITRAAQQCRGAAVKGKQFCSFHAGYMMPSSEDKRRCTATVDERQCRVWAVRGSNPPLCQAHVRASTRGRRAQGSRRRCQARNARGSRCANWATTSPTTSKTHRRLCAVHAGLTPAPSAYDPMPAAGGPAASRPAARSQVTRWRHRHWQPAGCTAITTRGARCRNWALPHSHPPRCQAHTSGRPFPHPDPHDRARGRQCTARTLSGRRCRQWAQRRPSSPADPPLCWLHDKTNPPGNLRHGYYRRTSPFTPSQQASIAAMRRNEKPLTAEILLVRLKLRALAAYLNCPDLSPGDRLAAMRLVLHAVKTISRLQLARHELAEVGSQTPPATGGPY